MHAVKNQELKGARAPPVNEHDSTVGMVASYRLDHATFHSMGIFDQGDWPVRFEWGLQGVEVLGPISDVLVIVDVLRFTTTVCAAVERDAEIYPYAFKDSSVHEFARRVDAEVAGSEGSEYSLSPNSMEAVSPGTRLVLPSPNGSALSSAAGRLTKVVIAGCLRNARSVARSAERRGASISIIASGERWKHNDELRPAIEDLLGAGAIISYLNGAKSPEARVAESAFGSHRQELESVLLESASGRELVEKGFADDVSFAARSDSSEVAPVLRNGAFRKDQP